MSTDTATAAELVTEEILEEAADAYRSASTKGLSVAGLEAALRAVAPMIAARAMDDDRIRDRVVAIAQRLVAAEREAIAKLVREYGDTPMLRAIASAIRARGETP